MIDRLLLREFTHRISNELAGAITLIAAARVWRGGIADEHLQSIQRALEGLAVINRLLYVPELRTQVDGCAYVRQLCLALGRAKLQDLDVHLEFTACPLSIDSEQCWRLGMILHELITNALKHASNGGARWIRIELAEEGENVLCRVEDSGSREHEPNHGLGLSVVHELTREMGGSLKQRFGQVGSLSILVFPERSPASVRGLGAGST